MSKANLARSVEVEAWINERVSEPEDGLCREWPFGRSARGYGTTKKYPRVTHEVLRRSGVEQPDGKPYVLHSCDNPPCCARWHLRWGNQADNMRDASDRNRMPHSKGELNPLAKLSEADVVAIRTTWTKRTGAAIAASFGISLSLLHQIVRGEAWAHVEPRSAVNYKPGKKPTVISDDQVRDIRRRWPWASNAQMAGEFGISVSLLNQLVRGDLRPLPDFPKATRYVPRPRPSA